MKLSKADLDVAWCEFVRRWDPLYLRNYSQKTREADFEWCLFRLRHDDAMGIPLDMRNAVMDARLVEGRT